MENKNNNLLKLTIESKPTQLNNLKLVEVIPTDILKLLINSTLLKQTFNNPFSNICFENEKQQLEKYNKLIKNGKVTVIYNLAKNMKYGRVTPKSALGLFSIRREIRHTLARDNYIDIDVENCHPVLLYQLCNQNNISCKYLKKYIDNRTELLNEVMTVYNVTKDDAKQLFIQLLYFGTFNSWCINHNINQNIEPIKFITKFKKELNMIGDIIVANNPKLSKVIETKKEEQHIKDYNIKGSVCSYFLQEYENRILECVYLYCIENKIIINSGVLCADGLMIPLENYKPELLQEFKNIVYDKLGFIVNFTKKDMSQGYTIEQLQETQIKTDKESLQIENIITCVDGSYKDISNLIKNEFINSFVYSSSKTYFTFNEATKLWQVIDINYIINEITELLQNKINSDFEAIKNKSGIEDVINNYKKANKLIGNPDNCSKMIKYLSNYISIENFEEKLNRSYDYLLPVKNGYCINLENNSLIERTKEHYFTFEIDVDYNPDEEISKAKEYFSSIMNNDANILKYFQKVIGSFLCSQTEAESIYIFWGSGSNSKSVCMTLISKVLNKFCATIDKGLFMDSKNKNNLGPKPKKLVLKDLRLAIISETEENEKLNECFLKNISGGDQITARGLNKDPITFKPKLSPVILTNNKPVFDTKSAAMLRRIKFIPFKAKFKENPKEGEQKLNKYLVKQLQEKYMNQILKFMVLGAIEFIKNPDMTPPKELEEDMNKYIQEINPSEYFIKSKLEVTENDKDRILRGDLYEIYKKWSIDNGVSVYIKKSDFYKTIDEKLGQARPIKGNYYYLKIKEIKDEPQEEEDEEIKSPFDV